MKKVFLIVLVVCLSIISCKKKDNGLSNSTFNPTPADGNADLYIKDTLYSSYNVSPTVFGGTASPMSGNYTFSVKFNTATPNVGNYPLSSNNPIITIFNTGTGDSYTSTSGTASLTKYELVDVPYSTVSFSNAIFTDANNITYTVSGAMSY